MQCTCLQLTLSHSMFERKRPRSVGLDVQPLFEKGANGKKVFETNSLQAIRWNYLIKASWSSGNLVVGKLRHDQNSEDLQLISDGLVIHTLVVCFRRH